MNVNKVISELKTLYPTGNIVLNTPENTTEIICELDPVYQKKAVAVIDYSARHFHREITETYVVTKGHLVVYLFDRQVDLKVGDSLTIKPNTVHYAKGNETWFMVYSTPGWKKEDHILLP